MQGGNAPRPLPSPLSWATGRLGIPSERTIDRRRKRLRAGTGAPASVLEMGTLPAAISVEVATAPMRAGSGVGASGAGPVPGCEWTANKSCAGRGGVWQEEAAGIGTRSVGEAVHWPLVLLWD